MACQVIKSDVCEWRVFAEPVTYVNDGRRGAVAPSRLNMPLLYSFFLMGSHHQINKNACHHKTDLEILNDHHL